MKKHILKLFALTLCLGTVGFHAFAQNQPNPASSYKLLNLVEIPDNGKQITIEDDFKIVEPNSTIQAAFDTTYLKTIIAGSTLDPYTAGRLTLLKEMLTRHKAAMDSLSKAYQLYIENQPVNRWLSPLKSIHPYAVVILSDRESRAIFNATLKEAQAANPHPTDKDILFTEYNTLFTTASKMISQILLQIESAAKSQGVYVQLGAWLDVGKTSTPIHINGFDEYTPQTPSTVQRFIITLNAQQQADLGVISALADSANKNGLGSTAHNLAATAGQVVSNKLTSLPSYTKAIALVTTLQALAAEDQAQLGVDKQILTDAFNDVSDFVGDVKALINKYNKPVTGTDANQMLLQVNDDISQLTTNVKAFQTSLSSDINSIAALPANATATLKDQVDKVKSALTDLKASIISDIQNLTNSANLFQQLILGQQVANLSHDFTDKVRQLTIAALPQNAIIDLTTAGTRDQGSKLYIKVAIGKAGQPAQERYNRSFDLYFCSVYARTAVGFLFVDPVPLFKRSGENALFRFAPSYSVLLKGFWKSAASARKSISYHNFFDPGLGLNFAALNFKGDGSVAFGVGGVFTLFNDFVQVGSGINTFDGRGYLFFGFKLPVGALMMR